MFKLGVIFDQHAGVGGGYHQAINAALLAKQLSKNNVDVIYFTTYKDDIKLFSKFGIKLNYLNFNFYDKFVSSLKKNFNHPRLLYLFKKVFRGSKFENILKKKNINLVYFLSPSSLAQELDELNFIITVWDLNHKYGNEFPEIRNINFIQYLDNFYNQTLKKAYSIIVDSDHSKKDINRYYSINLDRINVIPFEPSISINKKNLINNTDVQKKYDLNYPYVFYPAQFWSHKNHIYILEGIKNLEQDFNIKIGAIFSGSDQGSLEYIKRQVEKLGLSERIRFIGFVDNKEIPELYLQSIALVMPTFLGPTNIPPLEAFQLGVPVLYSNLPGLKDQVKDAALLIDLKRPKSMAGHINNLINDEIFRKKIIKLGKDRADYFNKVDRYKILKDTIEDFKFKASCWQDINTSTSLNEVIFVVDSPFSAIMVSSIIVKENIIKPRVIIEIKEGVHRFDGFEKSIKDLLSVHDVIYEKIITVPTPFYIYLTNESSIEKLKKLNLWKKNILNSYKPDKNLKYIGSTSSGLMKIIDKSNSLLFDDGASSYISQNDYKKGILKKIKNQISYLFFKSLNLENMRFKNTAYSAFPFKENSDIISLSEYTTPPVIEGYLKKFIPSKKKVTLILCNGTHHILKEMPVYKKKYNDLYIRLIKSHCSKDETLLIKFHQSVFGTDSAEEILLRNLIELGFDAKNIDSYFPNHLKSRVPAEIIINHYKIKKIISSGSSVNFNYANTSNIENIIDLSIYKDKDNGSYSLSENADYTKILSDLYSKLNKMTFDRINIDY